MFSMLVVVSDDLDLVFIRKRCQRKNRDSRLNFKQIAID